MNLRSFSFGPVLFALAIPIALAGCPTGSPGGTTNGCEETAPYGTGCGDDGTSDTGGVDDGGADTTSTTTGDPVICEPCLTQQDCCEWAGHPSGAVFPNYPHLECPGPYPNNWTCRPDGRCVNACDPQVPCPIPGFVCLSVDSEMMCVPGCQNDGECTGFHNMKYATCSGVADDQVTEYCAY